MKNDEITVSRNRHSHKPKKEGEKAALRNKPQSDLTETTEKRGPEEVRNPSVCVKGSKSDSEVSLRLVLPPPAALEVLPRLLQQRPEVVQLFNAGGQSGESVEQSHDLLPRELEAFGRTVFWKALDLFLGEQDPEGRSQTLSL